MYVHRCRHLEYKFEFTTVASIATFCVVVGTRSRQNRSKRWESRNIVGPYIPYGLFQTTGEMCAKFGSDRFRNVDLYKVQTYKHSSIYIYICDNLSERLLNTHGKMAAKLAPISNLKMFTIQRKISWYMVLKKKLAPICNLKMFTRQRKKSWY